MKYLLLLTNPSAEIERWESLSAEEAGKLREQELPAWEKLSRYMGQKEMASSGLELQLPSAAKTVQVRNGETIVTDGPYAETKEQIGGFLLVACANLDEAIDLARRVPVAARGSVEIRALVREP